MTLSQFTQTDLLRSIGESRIAKLLNHFSADLLNANINIPNREEQNGQYLDSVAAIFRESSRLPHRMLHTLLTLENAATSENQDRLEASIKRQPDELSLRDCLLDRALELWFVAPEELSQFATPPSQIENQNPARDLLDSKIENDPIPLSSISNGGEGQGEEAFKPSQPQDLPINGQPETKSPSDHGDGTSPPQIEIQKSKIENDPAPSQIQNRNSKIENALPLSSAPSGGEGRGEEELNGSPGEEASQIKNDHGFAPSQFEILKSKVKNDDDSPLPKGEGQNEGEGSAHEPGISKTTTSVENAQTPVTEVDNTSSLEAAGSAPSPIENQNSKIENEDDRVFARLAKLTLAQYDRVRLHEAQQLRIRAEILDREVARFRAELEYQASVQAILAKIPACEPWPEPITDAPALFHEVSGRYTCYLVLPAGAADACALWTGDTYVFDAFIQTPRLNLSSPIEGCGKSTAIDVLFTMVRRPLQSENLRAAVLFRIVDQIQPTLLLDEVDTYLPGDDELRGLLNAGHKHGATVFRYEGCLRSFNAFAPAALAGIGHLPATLHDRSIHIPLIKALPGEAVAHFDKTQIEVEQILARKLARWAKDNYALLKATRPVLPPSAYNRLGDNWRPLFAIAQVIGGDWPARVLASFNHLTVKPKDDAQSLGIRLLSDIRQIFMESGAKRLPSKNLVATLLDMADRPWPEANTGRGPINERWLARHLSPFGINAVILRIGDQRLRGYELSSFTDAFTRFLQ